MSGDLLRALTHELRNSIAPIVNAVHLIRLRGGKDSELAGILSIIDRQIAGMTHTLEAVAEADRLARGEIALQLQPNGIDSNMLVRFVSPADIKGTSFLEIEHSAAVVLAEAVSRGRTPKA